LQDIDSAVVAVQRKALTTKVHERLGVSSEQAVWLHLPDGEIPRKDSPGFSIAVMQLDAIVNNSAPDAVFVTHPLDTWPFDHIAAFELVEAVIGNSALRCNLYAYWVWLWYSMPATHASLMDWNCVYRIPVHNVMHEKKDLMDLYLTPLAPDGRPWSGVLPKALIKGLLYPYEVVSKFR
jgi:LmbE family N-acetylglucosaminyl deacetylase